MPRISVLMGVYNGEQYLKAAIESILTQSFSDFEFLIVDDGSTDSTAAILASIHDPRLRLLSNEHNVGVGQSMNRALALANGEYIARMDADDVALPTRFELQIRFLADHPTLDILGTWMTRVDPHLKQLEDYAVSCDQDSIVWALLFGCMIANPTVMMRRTVLESTGGYELDSLAEDYGLWARVAGKATFANLPEKLLLYRHHTKSTSSARQTAQQADIQLRRRQMLSRLFEREIDATLIEWLARSQLPQMYLGDGLSDLQIEGAINLIFETYSAMKHQGWITDPDGGVYHDAVQRTMSASRCSGKVVLPGELIRYWRSPIARLILRGLRAATRPLNGWPSQWY